jgi:aminoglycoside phosphotransferase (APT) family kinase protein
LIVTSENVVHYLLERGFVTRDSVVNGGVEISEIPRRNRNFRITQRGGQGYFLKQVRQWDPETVRTLRTEAECYKLAAGEGAFAAIAEIVPRFRLYDQRRSVLITELLDGAETITEHHFKSDKFPIDVAEQLGRAFGAYHRRATGHATEHPPAGFDGVFLRRPPWIFSVHEMPSHATASLSGGIHQMLAMIRQFPQFRAALENLRSNWRLEALMHGDIKWENCVLCPGPNGPLSLKIVDWELADWGDSCWDLAGIVSAYLSFWVQSLPTNTADTEAMVAQARYPVERMQPAIQSFWRTYASCRGVSPDSAHGLLRRTVLYTGARMIQTAFETLQMSPSANSSTVCLLQLSMNVMENPEDATRELLGIEP